MLVRLKHGTCKYLGTSHVAGDQYEITQRYYDANHQRYEIVNVAPEVSIRNVIPETKPVAEVVELDAPEKSEAPKQDYQSSKKNKKNK